MDVQSFYPSKYLKGSDLDQPEYTRLIVHVGVEEITPATGKAEKKLVIAFDEPVGLGHAKHLALKKTNAKAIAQVLSSNETDDWVGQSITVVRELWQGQPAVRIQH